MNWVNHYLEHIRYVDGGRGPVEYDCWGLVREVRAKHLGLSLLPEYASLRNTDPRAFTHAYLKESRCLRECQPCHGAIAAVMIGRICTHVAIVLESDDELWVLEINPEKGPRRMRLTAWLNDQPRVTFHND